MATENAINLSSSGIVRYDGAGTFAASSVTQHDLLIGGASNAITSVAPSATSGVPVISQGASADPAFGTAVVAGGGTGAVTLTGLVIGNGTSAMTASAITQHDVLVGGATNAVTSVAPSATSGVPLISQGASSDPAFGTAVVAGGGTGLTSATAYAVLCGGTTTTGPFQSIAGVGTSGQVLTSNGAGALPTFQAGGGGGGITTINGDTGSITGSTVTIKTAVATQNCGSTVKFVNSSATSTLNVTDSLNNVIIGLQAGNATISGTNGDNSGLGYLVLNALTTGGFNTAIGSEALELCASANNNVAVGAFALSAATGGSNTACGTGALGSLDSGNNNIALGSGAGANYTTSESGNILIGNQGIAAESDTLRIGNTTTRTFVVGINGVSVTGAAVIVSSSDQLGIIVSSRKFKRNIQNMDDSSSDVLKLRPVTFKWKPEEFPNEKVTEETQYGLIAEEVEKIFPYLVVKDDAGVPISVKYHELPAILLNELIKMKKEIEELKRR